MSPKLRRFGQRAALGFCALVGLMLAVHVAVRLGCRIEAPAVTVPNGDVRREGAVRRFGASFVIQRPGLLQVHLRGDPVAIGYAHARLLYPEMVENEGVLLESFREAVPTPLLRYALLDLAQVRYRNVAQRLLRRSARRDRGGRTRVRSRSVPRRVSDLPALLRT